MTKQIAFKNVTTKQNPKTKSIWIVIAKNPYSEDGRHIVSNSFTTLAEAKNYHAASEIPEYYFIKEIEVEL